MKKIVLVLIFVIYILSGCSSSELQEADNQETIAELREKYGIDENGNSTKRPVYTIKKNQYEVLEGMDYSYYVEFIEDKFIGVDGDLTCTLDVTHTAKGSRWITLFAYLYMEDWLFLEEYRLQIDDKIYVIKDENPRRNVLNSGKVSEMISYSAPDHMINDFLSAESVRIEIGWEIIDVDPEAITTIKELLNKHWFTKE